MRRTMLAAALLLTLVPLPAQARETSPKKIVFETTAPCGGVCPHWQSVRQNEAFAKACEKNPTTVPGSWDDVRVKVPASIAGRKPTGLHFILEPGLEYDGFICKVVNAGKTNETYKFGVTSANQVSENCDALFMGCREEVRFAVRPGQTIVMRAYNWSDGQTCPGSYSWIY